MGRKNRRRGSWIHVGRKHDAEIFVDLDTGETKHLGTKATSNDPKLYDGEPSTLGYYGGQAVKKAIGFLQGAFRPK